MLQNKSVIFISLLIFVLGAIIIVYFINRRASKMPSILPAIRMQLTSPAFQDNEYIPRHYTCDGANVNPPLNITGVAAEAKSLALIVDDPDAPRGDWVHWTVWNINPSTTAIGENTVPAGSQEGQTDFGRQGYGGPCPPSGVHHYQFKIYALDIELNLDRQAKKSGLEQAMQGHITDQAVLVGLYERR